MSQKVSQFIGVNQDSTVLITDSKDKFDWSLIVIWFIALLSVFLGALWTRLEFIKLLTKKKDPNDLNEVISDEQIDETTRITRAKKAAKQKKKEEEEKSLITLNVGYVSIFVLLMIVCAILLLLYFFYNIMSK